jgi:hypothetical protein
LRRKQGVSTSIYARPGADKLGHRLRLHLDLPRPTKVQLAYGGCGIRRVNVVDYIAGSRQPGLSQLPPPAPMPSIALRFDGRMLPKAGVGFVWVLERAFPATEVSDTCV